MGRKGGKGKVEEREGKKRKRGRKVGGAERNGRTGEEVMKMRRGRKTRRKMRIEGEGDRGEGGGEGCIYTRHLMVFR